MIVNAIVAVGSRGQIGLNGNLPWHEPNDLKWFKELTLGGNCIVGYNTAKTLPRLINRKVYVDDTSKSPEEMIKEIKNKSIKPIWIIGGSKTYKRYSQLIDRWYISKIKYNGDADTYFDFSCLDG